MKRIETMIDYWDLLETADKIFIINRLQGGWPHRYNNLHLGSLALVDRKTVINCLRHGGGNSKEYYIGYTRSRSKEILRKLNPTRRQQTLDRQHREKLKRGQHEKNL